MAACDVVASGAVETELVVAEACIEVARAVGTGEYLGHDVTVRVCQQRVGNRSALESGADPIAFGGELSVDSARVSDIAGVVVDGPNRAVGRRAIMTGDD